MEKKKRYIKPEIAIIQMSSDAQMMAGSTYTVNTVSSGGSYIEFSEEEITEADAGSIGAAKRHSDVWE